jgi:hypothetical protein
MRALFGLVIVVSAVTLSGCAASDDREWMKVNQRYTKEEFQRDHRECSRKGDLDEACMRQRGWVAVNPTRSAGPKPPDPLQQRR